MLISGCAGGRVTAPGVFNGLGNDYMAMLVIYRTDDLPFTKAQYEAVNVVANKMGFRIVAQLSSPLEAGAASGTAMGLVGAAGAATQNWYFPSAMVGPAIGYAAGVYALGGTVNGLISFSYAKVSAVATAIETALRDMERFDGKIEFNRIHVTAAYVRSRNNEGSPAPGLIEDWDGPKVGSKAN